MTYTRIGGILVVAALACAACSGPAPSDAATTSSGTPTQAAPSPRTPATTPPPATPTPSPETPAAPTEPTLAEKVGQLFMVGVSMSNPGQVSYDAVRNLHVGNVFLQGRTHAGVQRVRNLADSFTALSAQYTAGVPMFVASDQEGGQVQALQGTGFDTIPSALEQSSLSAAELRSDAARWGSQMAAAGVNLDLAPDMDLVASEQAAAGNPPVGALDREYGYTADSVTTHANAFAAGLRDAGVASSIKHFPGLGQVSGNTDTTAGVTDTTTGPDSPPIAVFKSGIDAGAPFVMMSTAMYSQIDPGVPAAFSAKAVNLLRQQGFDGVIITDDVSNTAQVAAWSPGDRAIQAIDAGCDMVLVSANPAVINDMVSAVVARAQSDSQFAAKVDAAYAKVISAKTQLLGSAG